MTKRGENKTKTDGTQRELAQRVREPPDRLDNN